MKNVVNLNKTVAATRNANLREEVNSDNALPSTSRTFSSDAIPKNARVSPAGGSASGDRFRRSELSLPMEPQGNTSNFSSGLQNASEEIYSRSEFTRRINEIVHSHRLQAEMQRQQYEEMLQAESQRIWAAAREQIESEKHDEMADLEEDVLYKFNTIKNLYRDVQELKANAEDIKNERNEEINRLSAKVRDLEETVKNLTIENEKLSGRWK